MQVRDIEQSLAHLKAESQLASLKKDLQMLSTECRKAFVAAGLQDSDHPQVRRALELCLSHATGSHSTGAGGTKTTESVGALWKKDGHDHKSTEDTKELACSILGKELVDALIEKDHQPPDVSQFSTIDQVDTKL